MALLFDIWLAFALEGMHRTFHVYDLGLCVWDMSYGTGGGQNSSSYDLRLEEAHRTVPSMTDEYNVIPYDGLLSSC